MHEVEELFANVRCQTTVWMTASARNKIVQYLSAKGRNEAGLLQKLEYWAKAGFRHHEGGEGEPIKHEWGGVYRIGQKSSLFRIIGFYETEQKTTFIAIDAFLKKRTKLSGPERDRIDAVVEVKSKNLWKKKVPNGDYPRLTPDS